MKMRPGTVVALAAALAADKGTAPYQLAFRDYEAKGHSKNANCPCGSGKKFKKCCLAKQ